MTTIKALKTMRYAGRQPHLPTHLLVEGKTYTSPGIPAHVLTSALENDFAEVVESVELEKETKVITPESKEKGMKGKNVRK